MTDIVIPTFTCECGYEMNRTAEARGDSLPKKNDVNLCIKCARVYLFNEDRTMREPTEEELSILKSTPEWYEVERVRGIILKQNLLP